MKPRKTREEILEEIRKVISLAESGQTIREACEQIGIHLVSFYKYRKFVTEQSKDTHLPAVADTHAVTTVQIHDPTPQERKQKKSYGVQKIQQAAPCAVFIGDIASCARFLKEFQ